VFDDYRIEGLSTTIVAAATTPPASSSLLKTTTSSASYAETHTTQPTLGFPPRPQSTIAGDYCSSSSDFNPFFFRLLR